MRTLLLALALCLVLPAAGSAADLVLDHTPVHIYFSPDGGAEAAILRAIGEARQSVLVQGYIFTSAPIAQALVEAKGRGVLVEAVLDRKRNAKSDSCAPLLARAGIPVFTDGAHAVAHNKVILIDRQRVITGSFNFQKRAEDDNAENLLVLDSPELARLYLDNYAAHRGHSAPYQEAAPAP